MRTPILPYVIGLRYELEILELNKSIISVIFPHQ